MDKDTFDSVFLGKGNLPITEGLIDKLVKEKGMKREDLEYFRDQGFMYVPSRNSFVSPLEYD